jgi:hypothetical protein
MSVWTLVVLATAGGGALLLWHMVSRTKHVSEEMLVKYAEMLAKARADKAKALAEEAQAEAESEVVDTAPAEE